MSAPFTRRTISILPLAGLIVIVSTLPGLGQADKPSAAPVAAPPVPTLTVPAGERLVLELETPLHTRATKKDDIVEFVTHRDLVVGRRVVIPQGAFVRATVTKSKRPGRIKGKGEIHLQFNEIELPDGTRLPFSARLLRAGFIEVKGGKVQEPKAEGDGDTARDVMVVAQGGLQGVLLGGALGGRKGAAYGGAVGAGIGLLGMLLRRGPDLDLPRGTLFEVELNDEMAVPVAATSQLATRQKPVIPTEDGAGNFRFPDLKEEAEPAPKFEDTEARTEQPPTESTAPNDKSVPPTAAPSPAPEWKGPPPSEGSYTFKVDVALVTMETVVQDPAGRAMDNLKKKDFRVLEDGVEQDIRHFSRDEFPLAVALVVDRSGSVGPFMRELRNAAYQTLSQLKRGDQVALFSFAGETRLLEGLTTDRQRVADRIARIRPGGGTNIIDALFEASDYLARAAPDRRRAIILISDNQHTMRASNNERTLLRYLLESETVVYSVKTQGENSTLGLRIPTTMFGGNLVKGITKETGGEVIKVRGRGSLAKALEIVISRLKLRYTLGYVSANKARDGRFRRVEIRLSDRFGEYGRNYSTLHRRGYYALTASTNAQIEP